MADELHKESCLLETQHGYEGDAEPLSDAALDKALKEAQAEDLQAEAELAASVASRVQRPNIHRVYQAKAATYKPRARNQIDSLILHTPEGYEGGTLSVLRQGRAGFDWFLPPSGNLYKCNAFGKYVAWQAGYWPYNLRSIGIEQWDFAGNMGNAGDAHYRRLADLVAWLTQLLDIPVRHADYGQPGLIAHAQVTPRSRTDPGKDFDWDKLIRYTRQARKLADPGEKPGLVHRVIAGAFSSPVNAGKRERKLQAKGFAAWSYEHEGVTRVQAGSFDTREKADDFVHQLSRAGFEAFIASESPKA